MKSCFSYISKNKKFLIYILKTANTALWLLYNLGKFPQVQEKVLDEIQRVVPPGENLTSDMVARMPLLRGCVRETLR